MSERFKSLVISHAIVIENITHTVTHDFSMSITCKYCKPLIKLNLFNEKAKSIVEKIGGPTKAS